jgi:glycosyltransferase involved in cell wall biosynthesis
VGVDATCWHMQRGFGRHARGLLGALLAADGVNRYTFFSDSSEDAPPLPAGSKWRRVRTASSTMGASAAGQGRSVRDLAAMSRALSDPELDLLLFPTAYSFVPVFSRARKVVLFHDVTAELYPDLALGAGGARLLWRLKVALARWQAHAVATVSEHSRAGLARQFGISADSIEVLGECPEPVFRPLLSPHLTPRLLSAGLVEGRRFIVYVGGFAPLKNLPRLLSVFAEMASRYGDVDLVMVGEDKQEAFHWDAQDLRRQAREAGLEDRVKFTGYLPDDDLVELLNLAVMLVLPSYNEGFGLTAVEAAACACPVVATTASPLPQILGEGGIFVDPHESPQIRGAMERLLDDSELRDRMSAAALAAASGLSWSGPARQLLALMGRVVA